MRKAEREDHRERLRKRINHHLAEWASVLRVKSLPKYRLVVAEKSGVGQASGIPTYDLLDYAIRLSPDASEETISHEALHVVMNHVREKLGEKKGLGPSQMQTHLSAGAVFVEAIRWLELAVAGRDNRVDAVRLLQLLGIDQLARPQAHDFSAEQHAGYMHWLGLNLAGTARNFEPEDATRLLIVASRQPYLGGVKRSKWLPPDLIHNGKNADYSQTSQNVRTAKAVFHARDYLNRLLEKRRSDPQLLEKLVGRVKWID
jgi:hypothetical protein